MQDGGTQRPVCDEASERCFGTLRDSWNCSSFSERGKRQIWQSQQFKEVIRSQQHEEEFRLFCQALLGDIRSCIVADKSSSVDAKREKSYKIFYQ